MKSFVLKQFVRLEQLLTLLKQSTSKFKITQQIQNVITVKYKILAGTSPHTEKILTKLLEKYFRCKQIKIN